MTRFSNLNAFYEAKKSGIIDNMGTIKKLHIKKSNLKIKPIISNSKVEIINEIETRKRMSKVNSKQMTDYSEKAKDFFKLNSYKIGTSIGVILAIIILIKLIKKYK